ncbi:hypothetical protein SPRG_01931 [Saprolegnia parasitica CBS 223.65]|uniref:Uncharacterized protein n=1 Tax=Saprolegnia parasitica (strain CBS 223.65) TaxID=695850 RepID=A0A067CQZ1_SAPPC|nr:hypothetical protein SPRG_01931 [Saprolegnia parasitica CBS 223.65]KDO33119.1 hypothetical protein SPRG_01931 [Saprolegnia parasitica CBS 223.65]|eukprot:XP_012195886.1 hypothetical protein SPRG_01931 [Saprolegnia parasitica CBS 223.65]
MLSPPNLVAGAAARGPESAVPITIQPHTKEIADLRLPSRAIQIHRDTTSPSRFQAFAHSCPAGRPLHDNPPRGVRHAPLTPQIGSLPDPSFAFLQAPMPPLELPPPNRESLSDERFASPLTAPAPMQPRPRETVVQFASSCPAQLDGFLTRMTLDDAHTLLSQSPSLAILRDMRRGSYADMTSSNRRSLDRLSLDERDEYDSDEYDEAHPRDSQDGGVFEFEMP